MLVPQVYSGVLKRRDFFILILTLLLGQAASAFLLISLISSVFTKTGSNFAVSGIILSLAAPSFLLMAVAGLVADLVDRKKIIILANLAIAIIVLFILLSLKFVAVSISLSFLYFAGNSFFLPAISAASAQLVKKGQLAVANSIFILTLTGGQIIGFVVAAFILFLFGEVITLVVCEVLLLICVFLPTLLPRLAPRKEDGVTVFSTVADIARAFIYIFSSRLVWFFFLTFAAMQAVVAFGATLGPGFLDEVVGVTIDKGPMIFFPFIALGIILGAFLLQAPKVSESFLVASGVGVLGAGALFLGLFIKFEVGSRLLWVLPTAIFAILAGLGVIVAMIASRTVLQRKVSHRYQGTIFGANMILASFLASLSSPAAAGLEALFGYINIAIAGGILFLVVAALIKIVGAKWKF